MLVRVEEPMRVAPGGHVIELKAGEETDGSLADYLVATRCNVTVLESDATPAVEPEGDVGLSATLTATADVVHETPAEPVPDEPDVKPATKPKTAKAATK